MPTMEEIKTALGKMDKSSREVLGINENVNSNPYRRKRATLLYGIKKACATE